MSYGQFLFLMCTIFIGVTTLKNFQLFFALGCKYTPRLERYLWGSSILLSLHHAYIVVAQFSPAPVSSPLSNDKINRSIQLTRIRGHPSYSET